MAFCINCGYELTQGANFCINCGTAVAPTPVEEPIAPPVVPVAPTPKDSTADIQEEQEFLDNTYKLLRWEKKAWLICGIVSLCIGTILCIVSFTIGAYLVGAGIVGIVSSGKIPQYINNLYLDIRPTATRCGDVGMLILTILFGEVALIFFLINFIRVKSQGRLISRIEARQKGI